MMGKLLHSGLIALAFLAMGAAPASFTRDELDALEAERRIAEAKLAALEAAGTVTASDLMNVERDLIAAAQESRRREEQARAAELKLIDLQTRLVSARLALVEDEAALEDLLGVLATAGHRQPPALAVSPTRANEAIRRAIVARDAAPRLAGRAAALSGEIDAMRTLELKVRREQARLDAAEAVLALKAREIEQLAAAKRAAHEDLSLEAEALRSKVTALAQRADTLRTLITTLEANAPDLPGRKPAIRPRLAALPGQPVAGGATTMSDVQEVALPGLAGLSPLGERSLGQLQRPVAGLLARGYGERLPGGGRAEGLTIATRAGAQVSAPTDGRIEYAGTFRSYGEMLILRTPDGYHVILSGLGRLYGSLGDTVKAGEPVGQMTRRDEPPPELYMELRRAGEPMDPAGWMVAGR